MTVQIRDKKTLQLLFDNIGNLKHPAGWIKHPYFGELITPNRDGVQHVKRIFCEAIVLLLEENDRLRQK